MFKYFNKLFKSKKQAPKPLLQIDTRIQLIKRIGARQVVTSNYLSIESDMILIYKGADENRLFFEVRTNYLPDKYEAKDKDMIYFYKDHFKRLQYRKLGQ